MTRPKTHEERTVMINRIIELGKEQGRITTRDIVAMFNLHRTTAEKYILIAVQCGELNSAYTASVSLLTRFGGFVIDEISNVSVFFLPKRFILFFCVVKLRH